MSERSEVQNPLIRYAAEIGWGYVLQAEAITQHGGRTRVGDAWGS